MRLTLAAAGLLLTTSCAYWMGAAPIGVRSEQHSARSDAAVVQALEWWEAVAGFKVFQVTDNRRAVHVQLRSPPDGAAGEAIQDFTSWTVLVDPEYSYSPMIMAHELGHVLGLQHTPTEPNNLMFGGKYECDLKTNCYLSESQLAEIRKRYGK